MEALFDKLHNFKNRVALIDNNGKKLRYLEILKFVNELEKRIKKKSLVLILADNKIGSIISYICCVKLKYVAILIDKKISENDLKKLLKFYKPNYVFSAEEFSLLNINHKKIYNIYDSCLYHTNKKKLKLLNNLQLLLPTSGSMGSVKFVKLSRENIFSNAISIIKYLKIRKFDKAITNMPFYYSYMLSVINTHIHKGASILVTNETIVQKKFWNIYKKQKITSFNGVPYIYELLDRIGLEKVYLKSLRYITQAGGKLNDELTKKYFTFCKKKKVNFFIMYGQTEASPRISYLENDKVLKKIGSVGKPIPGVKIYIKDQNKKKITRPYVEGNIFCKGKNIMLGYANNYKDLSSKKKIFELNTGDIGFFDDDEYFYIKSRSKRIAKIYGVRIDLQELENKMLKLGIKVLSANRDNKIGIFYNPKIKFNLKKMKDKVYNLTNLNLKIFNFISLKKIPRTNTKKIDYKKLQSLI